MQMQIFRRVGLGLMALGLTLSAFAILSCGSSDDGTERNAALSGAGERPTTPLPQPPGTPTPVPANSRTLPVNAPGSGTAVLTVSEDHTQIAFVLTYTTVTNVAQAHIHVGGPDIAGPIILFLCTNIGGAPAGAVGAQPCPQGPSVTVTGTLSAVDLIPRPTNNPPINTFADAVTQVINGNTYTNVHTDDGVPPINTGPGDFPGGEIRGQNL
jgi:hypothetical protein